MDQHSIAEGDDNGRNTVAKEEHRQRVNFYPVVIRQGRVTPIIYRLFQGGDIYFQVFFISLLYRPTLHLVKYSGFGKTHCLITDSACPGIIVRSSTWTLASRGRRQTRQMAVTQKKVQVAILGAAERRQCTECRTMK